MVLGVGHYNGVIQIYPGLSLIAMATKIWDKMGYNSASTRDICEIFASVGGFSGLSHQILPTKFYPNQPLLPWQ